MASFSSDDTRFALSSLVGYFFGKTVRGLQNFKVSEELEGDPIYGNGQVAIGLPPGTHKASGSLATIPEEGDSILANIGPGWSQVPGSITATLAEPNNPTIYTVTLTRVYLRKLELDFGEAGGNKASMSNFEFKVLDPINWGGLPSVASGSGGIVGAAIDLATNVLFG